jgi:hypothetical protein
MLKILLKPRITVNCYQPIWAARKDGNALITPTMAGIPPDYLVKPERFKD